MERLRYAPSPTGPLHSGNLSTALFTCLRAKTLDAELYLRMDSLDPVRCKKEHEESILRTLRWAHLKFDGQTVYQRPDDPRFKKAFYYLRDRELVYPCFCSRKQGIVRTDLGNPVYKGICRHLSPQTAQSQIAAGQPHCWRFRVEVNDITLRDVAAGPKLIRSEDWGGDFVIWRRDGFPAYPLATVVDDMSMKITEINRGMDLLAPSAAQTLLFQAFGANIPRFLHFPLLTDEHGDKLSKRKKESTPERFFSSIRDFHAFWSRTFKFPMDEISSETPDEMALLKAASRQNTSFDLA
ncbi:MAG: tRNA glutamyl-Q(34) synthetase GluQRS [Acidobacteria bacterium]|nr:MAG: tRNA glutamyl-Q(34) synthetase GluQRS [Acidobacteriota bacterium]